MSERRALAGECARRARAGEAPTAIRKDLGISYKAYSRWAKLYGFRQGDLFPDGKRAGARVSSAAGQLPEGWKPGDMVWRAQLDAMSEETLRAHVEALVAPR